MSSGSGLKLVKKGVDIYPDAVRLNCLVMSSNNASANFIVQVENPGGSFPIVVPGVFYSRSKERLFYTGKIVRITVSREFNRRTQQEELMGRYPEKVNVFSAQEVPYSYAVKTRIILPSGQPKVSRQPRGPPLSTGSGNPNIGFQGKKSPGRGRSAASGDAPPAVDPLNLNCSLPVGSVYPESQQILPKRIEFCTEDESSSQAPEEIKAQLFGVDAVVVESKKISFVEDGCTFYGDLEESVEFTDASGRSTRQTRDSVQDRIETGQSVLVDVKIGHGSARVFGLKVHSTAVLHEQAAAQADDQPDQASEEHLNVEIVEPNFDDSAGQVPEQFEDAVEHCEVDAAHADDQPDRDSEEHLDGKIVEPDLHDSAGQEYERVERDEVAEENGGEGQGEEAEQQDVHPDWNHPETEDLEGTEFLPDVDQPEVMMAGSGEFPSSVLPVVGKFEPVAAEEELAEFDKMEKRLSSVYSCDGYIETEEPTFPTIEEPGETRLMTSLNNSSLQIEELIDNKQKMKPSAGVESQILEPIKEELEQMTNRQVAESAALEAVAEFMRKFLKYDEMAVEALLEGFQKRLLRSITEKYDS